MAKKNFIPAVSVVIPMYNSEKYIGECLQSIAEQSFKDFEVIVVDDCSTDKSCEVVEKFIPKFRRGGVETLKLFRSEKNSGNPGTPRNTGIRLSRGEYICFVDSDDAIMKNALEDLYRVAEKFNADVVHCERFFISYSEKILADKNNLQAGSYMNPEFVTRPERLTDDLSERIDLFCNRKLEWTTFLNFVRRDFILKNDLKFFETRVCTDTGFLIQILSVPSKIILAPNIVYVYRHRDDSVSRATTLSPEKKFERWGSFFLQGISTLENFFDGLNFFRENPQYKYAVYDFLIMMNFSPVMEAYLNVSPYEFDKYIREELSGVGDLIPLTAFIFNRMNGLNVQLRQQQEINFQLQRELEQFKSRII